MKYYFVLFLLAVSLTCCKQNEAKISLPNSELHHYCNQVLTDVIVYDILSPPVASRLYAYSNLAYYEALRLHVDSTNSFLPLLRGFDPFKNLPEKGTVNHRLAASMAFMKVAKALSFSKDSITTKEKIILTLFQDISSTIQEASLAWADTVAAHILKRATQDNYKLTRGMPKYSVFGEKGKWVQTPPEYADATEPHWRLIKPLLLDSASAFKPAPPPAYDLTTGSKYYQELKEVYDVSKNITPQQDTIAQYWDDNPFVTKHAGHFTYANKKITPVGHWIGMLAIFSRITNSSEIKTAQAYAIVASAIFDGFISCWDEKFRSSTVRPITVIRAVFESEWSSLLQTPPFPEYTSGHSVISAAAGTTATAIFGNTLAFHDTTEVKYLNMSRKFSSIQQAADEAGISRLYGGIHFRSAIEQGKTQGNRIGERYVQQLLLNKR
jgi:hypothetical protein